MPASLSTDRKLVLVSISIAVLLSGAILVVGGSESGAASTVPSTYSSASGGARAAFLLLQRLRFPVTRWEDSPVRLPAPDGDAVLVLADPVGEPSDAERAAVEKFVKAGGRPLFCGSAIERFFPRVR